jgi:hypothetical protein
LSFGNPFKDFGAVEELLILALTLISMVAVFYLNIAVVYKVGIVVFTFSMIFLVMLATQIMNAQKEIRKNQQ